MISTGRQGKMLIHLLHSSTKLSILCPGKSLNKALPVFPARIERLLRRLGYSRLIFQFQVHTKPEIYATNSRSLLAHMNQMKYAIEYRVALAEQDEDINYCDIEDILSDMLYHQQDLENMRGLQIYWNGLLMDIRLRSKQLLL